MNKYKSILLALGVIGSIGVIITTGQFMEADELMIQVEKCEKNQVELTVPKGRICLSEKDYGEVKINLVKDFDSRVSKDYPIGYVHTDELELHKATINEHFKRLKKEDKLPIWFFGPGEFNNDEFIKKIHNSMLND